jgi:hypothetical protein
MNTTHIAESAHGLGSLKRFAASAALAAGLGLAVTGLLAAPAASAHPLEGTGQPALAKHPTPHPNDAGGGYAGPHPGVTPCPRYQNPWDNFYCNNGYRLFQ